VHCYGYVLLTQNQEDDLRQRGFDDWNRGAANKGRPLRAIVKEYIVRNPSVPFTYEMLPWMRRDIRELNLLRIVVWDVQANNYRAGKLVDVS